VHRDALEIRDRLVEVRVGFGVLVGSRAEDVVNVAEDILDSMFAVENAPTSRPARVKATQGAG